MSFDLPKDSKVDLIIYDLLGREVIKLVNNEFRTAGSYNVSFNGSNLSSGVYFYKLKTADNAVLTKRMMLIK
ncbi:MAG TPA: T9SS type A sorting domain-containing protein [Ignavibacteria bacterium]|nr:T9SS type A sorting domain-containing protein [Ignavibacteria bacterium]